MGKPRHIGNQIKQLKSEGVSFSEIVRRLKCSKATVSYHIGTGQVRNRGRQTLHPFQKKIYKFVSSKASLKGNKSVYQWYSSIYHKIRHFSMTKEQRIQHKKHGTSKGIIVMFTVDDIVKKFGENPRCYLTGDPIDIYQPQTYHFDHIIPVSRGGSSDISNLGICTNVANQAKHNMTHAEFIDFCRRVIDHNDAK